MLKRIILFSSLSLLILACVVALFVLKNPQWLTKNESVKMLLQPTLSPTANPQKTLSITSLSPTLTPGQTNTLQVILNSQGGTERPHLIQLEISYDPTAILNVAITPGDFFINPKVLLNVINERTGRISYALQEATDTQSPKIQNNHVATISFTPNPAFAGRQTTITFLGKTTVLDTTNNNILTDTQGTTLFFASSSAQTK